MEDTAIKDFERFCADNDVKPTNMKANYYLAGYYKGQQRMIDKACEWLENYIIDYVGYDHLNGIEIDYGQLISQFKKAMEDEE